MTRRFSPRIALVCLRWDALTAHRWHSRLAAAAGLSVGCRGKRTRTFWSVHGRDLLL